MKTNHQQPAAWASTESIRSARHCSPFTRTRLFVMCVAVCLASNLCFATIYDVAADFSATNNPNGVWSYGWSSTLTSDFVQYTDNYKDELMGLLDIWSNLAITDPPSVAHNGTGSAIYDYVNRIAYKEGEFSLHPGGGGEYSHARWTAPYAGTFDIAAVFTLIDYDPGSTDVYVLYNGASLFGGLVNGSGDTLSFSTTVSVGMDDTIDFAVGYGNNWIWEDTTALSATIEAVPEPATLMLLVLGGLAVMRRRKA